MPDMLNIPVWNSSSGSLWVSSSHETQAGGCDGASPREDLCRTWQTFRGFLPFRPSVCLCFVHHGRTQKTWYCFSCSRKDWKAGKIIIRDVIAFTASYFSGRSVSFKLQWNLTSISPSLLKFQVTLRIYLYMCWNQKTSNWITLKIFANSILSANRVG